MIYTKRFKDTFDIRCTSQGKTYSFLLILVHVNPRKKTSYPILTDPESDALIFRLVAHAFCVRLSNFH